MTLHLRRIAACTALAVLTAGCTTAAPQVEYIASFNEPFLSFRSNGASMTVSSPDDLDGTTVQVRREEADGVVLFQGKVGEHSFTLGTERGECQDDMSGLPFSHHATLSGMAGRRELSGCARLTTEPQSRE